MNIEGNLSGSVFFSKHRLPPTLSSDESRSDEQTPINETDNSVAIYSRDKDTLILLETILEMWGYRINASDSVENFFSIIENRPPRLIILDSVIPFEANLETIRQIREDKSANKIPIVLLSGFSQPEFRSLTLAGGADGFFVKPVDFELLENFVRKNIKRHRKQTH